MRPKSALTKISPLLKAPSFTSAEACARGVNGGYAGALRFSGRPETYRAGDVQRIECAGGGGLPVGGSH